MWRELVYDLLKLDSADDKNNQSHLSGFQSLWVLALAFEPALACSYEKLIRQCHQQERIMLSPTRENNANTRDTEQQFRARDKQHIPWSLVSCTKYFKIHHKVLVQAPTRHRASHHCLIFMKHYFCGSYSRSDR